MGKLQLPVASLNDADALRNHLTAAERALSSISAETARAALTSATAAQSLLEKIENQGADVRAEQSRLETIDDRMVRSAQRIVSCLGGASAYRALREELAPGSTNPRWTLDALLADAARRLRMRLALLAVLLVVCMGAGYLSRGWLFPENPVDDATFAAERALAATPPSFPDALSAIENGLKRVPDSPQLLIWRGVLLEKQSPGSGAASFAQAQAGGLTALEFYVTRAQVNLGLQNPAAAVSDIDTLLRTNPDAPEAYYVRGTAYLAQGDRTRALEDYQKCSDLAQAQGNDTLFATAKVQMGMVMQQTGGGQQ